MTDGDDTRPGEQAGPEAVGSVAEEAAKLLGALSGWAREHGEDLGSTVSGLADGAAKAAHEVNEHVATGSAECTWCPVCRAVHTVRELSPEVKEHLATAGANLMQAAAALMATAVPDQGQDRGNRQDSVADDIEHIDLDNEWPEDQ